MKVLKYLFGIVCCMQGLFAEQSTIEKLETVNDRYLFIEFDDARSFFADLGEVRRVGHIYEGDSVELITLDGVTYDVFNETISFSGFYFTEEEKEVVQLVSDDEVCLNDGSMYELCELDESPFDVGDRLIQLKNCNSEKITSTISYLRFQNEIIKVDLLGKQEEIGIFQVFPLDIQELNIDDEETCDVRAALLHLVNGDIVSVGKEGCGELELSNSIKIVQEKDGDSRFFNPTDMSFIGFGQKLYNIETEKVIRKVVSIDEGDVIFDDGFVLHRNIDIPEGVKAYSLDVQVNSLNPVIITVYAEVEGVDMLVKFDCSDQFKISIEGVSREMGVLEVSITSTKALADFFALGKFSVGDEFECYRLGQETIDYLTELMENSGLEYEEFNDDVYFYYRKG